MRKTERFDPASFSPERHFYPRVLNAQMHAMVRYFLALDSERVITRYSHLNPRTDRDALRAAFAYQPRHFRWAGSDLMHVTTRAGVRHMVLVETNSCPSGQKSMPLFEEHDEQGGYRALMERTFKPILKRGRLPAGGLAVLYDKNPMETSGYAASMAELTGEPVHLVPMYDEDPAPRARFDDGVLYILTDADEWIPIRAAFRYVTQRPWNRIPVRTKTAIFNPVIACLAGGRNKMVAAKAYDLYNGELSGSGLSIKTPETFWNVSLEEVPLWVRRLGGHAVIKVPYSNAGQGVFTITTDAELDAFLQSEHRYDRFIVQALIGNHGWSSGTLNRRLFHVGTMPDRRCSSYVFDLRVMVGAGDDGFRPVAVYARRARAPLVNALNEGVSSWDVLGTNLSVKLPNGEWGSDVHRLRLMDRKDFNSLGLGLDDLTEAYVQSVLATIAIDQMAIGLIGTKGRLRTKLFRSLNDDDALINEILN